MKSVKFLALFLVAAIVILMIVTLGVALLMLSRFKYTHLVNQYIRGKKPVTYLIKLVAIVLAIFWQPLVTIAVGTNAYAMSGPIRSVWKRFRPGGDKDEKQ